MTKFEAIKNKFDKAVERIDEILKEPKSMIIRDSALKRFEFTFDLAWKVTRSYLKENKGVDCTSPKDCFKVAYQQGIIEYDKLWLDMTDWRNEIVHAYGEKFADNLYEKMPQIFAAFLKLQKSIEGK